MDARKSQLLSDVQIVRAILLDIYLAAIVDGDLDPFEGARACGIASQPPANLERKS